ncbi:MAG: hypothetical protein ACTSPG_02775 [Candidatus Hodarchaeales archaeon]
MFCKICGTVLDPYNKCINCEKKDMTSQADNNEQSKSVVESTN